MGGGAMEFGVLLVKGGKLAPIPDDGQSAPHINAPLHLSCVGQFSALSRAGGTLWDCEGSQ